jgi:pimeloyl-ACP methyl ester carboxylesterase
LNAEVSRRLHHAGGVGWQFHEAGVGHPQALVLLHPSPRSSRMYVPWMKVLAQDFHVLAVDTPGYGGSDPLPHTTQATRTTQATQATQAPITMADYLGPLRALLQDVAGPRFMLYGSATGAQIAIAYALAHAADVQHLCIDNAAHFDDDERAQMLSHYFPDLSPRADGSHLQTAWHMSAAMLQYFPWFEQNDAHRFRDSAPSAEEVQGACSELLAAGPGWARAYSAAFEHERAVHVQALRVPTTVLRWQGSILLKHIDRLLAHALPSHVQRLDVPSDTTQRFQTMTAHLRAVSAHGGKAASTSISKTRPKTRSNTS